MAITKTEAINASEFHWGQCYVEHGPRGGIKSRHETYRRNGKTQTWKTRPDEFRIPVKYGMSFAMSLTHADAEGLHVARGPSCWPVKHRFTGFCPTCKQDVTRDA